MVCPRLVHHDRRSYSRDLLGHGFQIWMAGHHKVLSSAFFPIRWRKLLSVHRGIVKGETVERLRSPSIVLQSSTLGGKETTLDYLLTPLKQL